MHAARRDDVAVPILENVLPSNDEHIQRAFEHVAATGKRRIGVFGLAFKPGTDDLRESPLVELAERLLGKGYDLRIYDPAVVESRAARREPRVHRGPPAAPRATSSSTPSPRSLDHAEVLRRREGGRGRPYRARPRRRPVPVIDLVRLPDAAARRQQEGYVGLAW